MDVILHKIKYPESIPVEDGDIITHVWEADGKHVNLYLKKRGIHEPIFQGRCEVEIVIPVDAAE